MLLTKDDLKDSKFETIMNVPIRVSISWYIRVSISNSINRPIIATIRWSVKDLILRRLEDATH